MKRGGVLPSLVLLHRPPAPLVADATSRARDQRRLRNRFPCNLKPVWLQFSRPNSVRWFGSAKDKSIEITDKKEMTWKEIEHGQDDVEFDSQLIHVKVPPYQPPQGGVVILWDLEQKPPVNVTAIESVRRLKALASIYGEIRGIYAFTCAPMDITRVDVTPTEQQLREWHNEGKEVVDHEAGWNHGEIPRRAQMMHGRR
jgi:hypothetical protein